LGSYTLQVHRKALRIGRAHLRDGWHATRFDLYKYHDTIFEKSRAPMHIWLQTFFLRPGARRTTAPTSRHRARWASRSRTARFMSHRIREAVRKGAPAPAMGGDQPQMVEMDETFIRPLGHHILKPNANLLRT
jgi:hypothetical protein